MRDQPDLLWVGDDDAIDVRRQYLDDGCRVACRLDNDVVVMCEFLTGKILQALAQHGDAAELHQLAIEQRHGLGRYPVNVHADNPHNLLLGLTTVEGAGGQHDNYGSALAAHPG
jgi:hypothetical protein